MTPPLRPPHPSAARATAKARMLAARDMLREQAALPLWMLFPIFFVLVFVSHAALLRLPYYWDEAGYYIPAAYDFFRTGSLIPFTTTSNAHPPLPSVLLAAWWHLSGFVPIGTRTAMCMVSALALLGVFRLARCMVRMEVAAAVTFLTGLYSVWFAQSTLAHADMFAAAATIWALSFYFERGARDGHLGPGDLHGRFWCAALFCVAVLCKETALMTPLALAAWEVWIAFAEPASTDSTTQRAHRGAHVHWVAALLVPILPLAAWFAYNHHRTGYMFGDPEFVRYNATATLIPARMLLAFAHRLLHLFAHMNMFVPVLCTVAAMLLPPLPEDASLATTLRPRIPLALQAAIGVVLLANLLLFSVLGGALLTRYLLPLYPLVLLECVATWRRRVPEWYWLVGFTAVAFFAGILINPPYRFAPEDNLSYRDTVILQQQAIGQIVKRVPNATVLTAWPAIDELAKPELGYVRKPVKVVRIDNFALPELEKAAVDAGAYDTALVFSTKYDPTQLPRWMHLGNEETDARYFDFHHDLTARQAALLLHGSVVWQGERGGLWAAVLRFDRAVNASMQQPGYLLPLVRNREMPR